MPMTSDDLTQVSLVMRTLDQIFPRDRRDDDFPPEAQNIDITVTMDTGFIVLDAKNRFAFVPSDSSDTALIEACIHGNERDRVTEGPDTVIDHEIVRTLESKTQAFTDRGVRRIRVDVTDHRPSRVRRVFDWTPEQSRSTADVEAIIARVQSLEGREVLIDAGARLPYKGKLLRTSENMCTLEMRSDQIPFFYREIESINPA